MKSEAELRELFDDLLIYESVHSMNPFTGGMTTILSYVLEVGDRCANPLCAVDHSALREEGIAHIRKKAAELRAEAAKR